MMMQESPGAAGIGNISSADQFAGRYKDQQRSKINPNVDDQVLKCPRCDSPNTKFCYYNNYNLTQPRHFCKTCRRYWTKGGALRNVPIGGGCRKNKRPKQRAAASKDQNPLMTALHHHHRHPNPNPHHHHHPHPQQQQQHGEESSSPAAMDVPSNLSLLQNIWGASNSNYLDLSTADSVGLALARLQNRPNLLGPAVMQPDSGVNPDRRPYSHPSGGHMATLMYENPSAILPSPSSSSAGMLAEGIAAASSNFGFAGPEPNFSNVAEDIMHWRIQQQSRLAVLQQHLAVDGNNNNNQNHNHSNSNANDNNIDLMLISSLNVNDQKYESRPADHHQQQKGKSIISNDLQAQWPAVADCLFEPHAVMEGESTSGYWYGLQQLAEN